MFLIQTLVFVKILAEILSHNIIQLTIKDDSLIEVQVPQVSF